MDCDGLVNEVDTRSAQAVFHAPGDRAPGALDNSDCHCIGQVNLVDGGMV